MSSFQEKALLERKRSRDRSRHDDLKSRLQFSSMTDGGVGVPSDRLLAVESVISPTVITELIASRSVKVSLDVYFSNVICMFFPS